jgi:hypothetical protein
MNNDQFEKILYELEKNGYIELESVVASRAFYKSPFKIVFEIHRLHGLNQFSFYKDVEGRDMLVRGTRTITAENFYRIFKLCTKIDLRFEDFYNSQIDL